MIRQILLLSYFLFAMKIIVAQDVTIQSEFEKKEGILLKWNYNENVDSTIARIASIISADDKVWIIYDPVNGVTSGQILSYLVSRGTNATNVYFTEGTAENPWLRDYGPVAGYYFDDSGFTRHFVDSQYHPAQYPQADFLTLQLTSDFGFNYDVMSLNFEGGNLLLDGIGRGFAGDRILSENPGLSPNQVAQAIYTKLILNEIIYLPSIPECGGGEWSEISRLVKFIDSETVLVSEFPTDMPYYQQVELIADTLAKTYNDVGKLLQVIRIPVAPDGNGEYAVSNSGTIQSYTSSIILNTKILVPSYDQSQDAEALSIYSELFPGYQVFLIPAQNLAAMHGSLYRLALNIPQPELFRIRHSKITGLQAFEPEIWVNAFVDSWNPVDSIQVFYKSHQASAYEVINTYGCCGGNSGTLSNYSVNDTISYYIQAYSGNHVQTLPIAAPEGVFTFWFDPYTNITGNPKIEDVIIYPNPASDHIFIIGMSKSSTTDSYQVFTLSGNMVAEGKIIPGNEIRLPEYLVNGLYMIKIINSGKTHICKLYLQH